MRDPSVHLKRSDLISIFEELGIDLKYIPKVLLSASKKSVRNRVILTLTAKSRQRAKRIIEAETDLVELFNRIYMSVMVESDIKTLSIHKNSPQYLSLKEITQQAKEFCELFELDYNQGFLIYVRLGVKILSKNYTFYRLKGAADRITDRYRTMMAINNDPSPLNTNLMYEAWKSTAKKYFNVSLEVKDDVNKYVHFVYAKQDADKVGADYTKWIEAQFEKWSFIGNMPEFSQLHGDNAVINYEVYINKKSDDTESDLEKKYFKTIGSGKEIPIKKAVAKRGGN